MPPIIQANKKEDEVVSSLKITPDAKTIIVFALGFFAGMVFMALLLLTIKSIL